MSAMRSLLLAGVLFCACAPNDPFVGTYNVTVSGTENETAPQNTSRNIAGMGTVAVTQNKERMGYLVTFGENYLCKLIATQSMSAPNELTIADGQSCNISGFTGTTTSAKLSMDTATMTTVTLTVSYTFTYTLLFVNHAGTGTRTFTGPRL